MGKKIIILGGGTGGLVVANRLSKFLSKDNEIVLVDKEKNHIFNPSLLWVMAGWRNQQKIQNHAPARSVCDLRRDRRIRQILASKTSGNNPARTRPQRRSHP